VTDRYAALRIAVAGDPTPGPWYWDKTMGGVRVRDHYIVQSFHSGIAPAPNVDELFIAAADPSTIAVLLAERDALAAALRDVLATIERLYHPEIGWYVHPDYLAAARLVDAALASADAE
jgi:hypothetical protein